MTDNEAALDERPRGAVVLQQDVRCPNSSTFCPVGGTSVSQRKDTSLKTALAEGNCWMQEAAPTQRRRCFRQCTQIDDWGRTRSRVKREWRGCCLRLEQLDFMSSCLGVDAPEIAGSREADPQS